MQFLRLLIFTIAVTLILPASSYAARHKKNDTVVETQHKSSKKELRAERKKERELRAERRKERELRAEKKKERELRAERKKARELRAERKKERELRAERKKAREFRSERKRGRELRAERKKAREFRSERKRGRELRAEGREWKNFGEKEPISMVGKASWYGQDFHGNKTASGHRYDMYTFTAAHRTLPFGTVVKVTSREEGKSVMVRVNDRGPYVRGRIIDLSFAAADQLGLADKGVGDVKLEIVSDPQGNPLRKGQAYFVQYKNGHNKRKSGPYHAFEVAAARQRELQSRHPDAVVVLDDTDK